MEIMGPDQAKGRIMDHFRIDLGGLEIKPVLSNIIPSLGMNKYKFLRTNSGPLTSPSGGI
jgi:hypothetical protein